MFIYFNLHKKVFSIKSLKTGRVIGYKNEIYLKDVIFKVSESGRQRVLKEKRKNVHAGIVGYLDQDLFLSSSIVFRIATYNPYKWSNFVDKETEEPLLDAKMIKMTIENSIPKIEYINS